MKARNLTVLAVAFLLCSTVLYAVPLTVNLTDPNPTYQAQNVNCTGAGGPWPSCGANGYLSFGSGTLPTDGFTALSNFNTTSALGEENFLTAFLNFASTAGGAGWTYVEKPALDDLTYNINTFQTFANQNNGGVTISIGVVAGVGYNGTAVPLNTLVWSQALLTNYRVTDPAGVNHDPPDNVMDDYSFSMGSTGSGGAFMQPCSAIPAGNPAVIPATPAGTSYCDPIYPFQDGSNGFGDMPTGLYPKDSFRAEAFLTQVNTVDKVLTIYDGGVNYGFDLYVAPEASTLLLLGTGLLGAVRLLRRGKS